MFHLPSSLDTEDPLFEKIRAALLYRLENFYRLNPRVTPLDLREGLEQQWADLTASIKSPPYYDLKIKLERVKHTIQAIQNFQLGVAFFEAFTGVGIEDCLGRPSTNGINKVFFKWENLQHAVFSLLTLSTDSANTFVEWLTLLMARDPRYVITLDKAIEDLDKIRGDKA